MSSNNQRSDEIVAVLRQALEALEWFTAAEPWDEPDVSKAITSLRQAIADFEKHSATHGEPVALETVYETIIHWDEGGGKRSRRELARRIEALYTHPYTRQPKQEPLTDEQAMDAYCETPPFGTYKEAFIAGIRFIEAVHGIAKES